MCGRYTFRNRGHTLVKGVPYNVRIDGFNVAPSALMPVGVRYVVSVADARWDHNIARWGFLPHWMPNGKPQINARAETVHEKPMFRKAFAESRCLVAADGFYEWKTIDGVKQPYFITTDPEFAFAGILTKGPREEGFEAEFHRPTFAILTTQANDFMQSIHHRMPVILTQDQWRPWIEEGSSELLRPYAGELHAWPVTRRMNNPRYNEPDSVEAIA